MDTGVVEGGWEFVWTAYGLTALILAGYALSLLVRLRWWRGPGQEAGPSEDEW